MRFLTTFFLGMVVGGGGVFFAESPCVAHRTRRGIRSQAHDRLQRNLCRRPQIQSRDWENSKELAAAIVHAKKEYISQRLGQRTDATGNRLVC